MISEYEILRGQDITSEQRDNLNRLLVAVNKLRKLYSRTMIVTSGFRTPEHNKAIGGAPNSNHCKCAAVDFADYDGDLKKFIQSLTEDQLEEIGLYYEDFQVTKSWTHCQIVKPNSGNRFFKP